MRLTGRSCASLRPEVASGDIGMLLVRLTRPLPGPIPPEVNRRLAHRHPLNKVTMEPRARREGPRDPVAGPGEDLDRAELGPGPVACWQVRVGRKDARA
jgi:hypothetical protein